MNIQTMIESGTFDGQILEGLGEKAEGDSLAFKVEPPKGLNALSVSLEIADKTEGLKILSDLSGLLLENSEPWWRITSRNTRCRKIKKQMNWEN